MREMLRIYNVVDVLLLCETFMRYRKQCYADFGLDPVQYLSLPGYSFSVFLYTTQTEIEMLRDQDQVDFVKRCLRGGYSWVNQHYAEADDPDMSDAQLVDGLDEVLGDADVHCGPRKHLKFFDFNSLYGTAMQFKLAKDSFQFMDMEECKQLEKKLRTPEGQKIDWESDEGCFIECTVDYPEHLHAEHDQLPFLIEQLEVNEEMLSPRTIELMQANGRRAVMKQKKLVASFREKKNYCVMLPMLQQALSHGLRLVSITKALKYKQTRLLKDYINELSVKRGQSTCGFTKSLYKLMICAIYGKLLSNSEHYVESRVVRKASLLEKYVRQPLLKDLTVLSEDMVVLISLTPCVVYDECWLTAACVLEISKFLLYDFLYDVVKPLIPDVQVVLGDTDSVLLYYTTDREEQIMDELSKVLDYSKYPKDHPRYSRAHENEPFFLKDECPGTPMKAVVALRPKNYAFTCYGLEGTAKITAKGISRGIFYKELHFENFVECFQKKKDLLSVFGRISSRDHQVSTVRNARVGLSVIDTKKYWLNCDVHSLPFSDSRIESEHGECPYCLQG